MAEESPPKRRRLSKEGEQEAPPAAAAAAAASSSRPSFGSPTKASLARFNPRLLPAPSPRRPRSTEPPQRAAPPPPGASATTRSSLGGTFAAVGPRRRSRSARISEPPQPRPAEAAAAAATPTAPRDDGAPGAGDLSTAAPRTLSARPRRFQPRRLHEPELPPTPEALGLKPRPAQPQGILSSSSPTTRAAATSKRSKTLKSSPLKQRQQEPAAPAAAPDPESAVQAEERLPKDEEKDYSPETLEKEATLRRLRERVNLVRDDVAYLERAVTSLQQTDGAGFGFVSENKVISILTSTDPNYDRPPSHALPLSLSLAQFLPFSRPHRHQEIVAELERIDPADALSDAYRPQDAAALALTLGIEPRITVSSTQEIDAASLQNHTSPLMMKRHFTLFEPSSLFRLKVTTSIASDAVMQAVQLADLSAWAEREFGAWSRAICASGDLPALGRGFATYWELNVRRAQCWARCAATHAAILHDPDPNPSAGSMTRAAVHAHLGQRTLQLSRKSASLLVSWDIQLDWTGNATSHVSADAALPATWRDQDTRKSFAGVGDAFRRLVKERGVEGAVAVLVKVLLGEDGEDG